MHSSVLSCARRYSVAVTTGRSGGSGDSNSTRLRPTECVNVRRAACRNGRSRRCTARTSSAHVAVHAAIGTGSPTIGWPIALRWTRIWCVRPVAIATWISETPFKLRAQVTRVTALRARRAASTSSADRSDRARSARRCRLPGLHEAPDQRDVLLFDFAIVELPRQLLMGARRSSPTTMTPDVPRSSRCTMPGRSSPPTPLRSST